MRVLTMSAAPDGHSAPITHVGFSADGTRLATSSYDGSVIIWDSARPRAISQIARLRHRRLVNGSAWHPRQPDLLATASADKTVLVWRIGEAGDAEVITGLARHTDDMNSVAWLPDGERLVCVSEDGAASMWNGLTGKFLGAPVSHAGHCMMVATSKTGLVATVGEDGKVAVLDPDSGAGVRQRHYKSSIEGCAWSHGGDLLALVRDDGSIEILNADLSTRISLPVSSSAARSVAWSCDDAVVAVGAYDGTVHLLGADGTARGRVRDDRMWPRSVAAAPGAIAVGSFWSRPHLFDLRGAVLSGPATPTHGPNAMAASGGELLVGCDSGVLLATGIDKACAGVPAWRRQQASAGPLLSLSCHGGEIFAGTYSGHVLRPGTPQAVSRSLGAPVPSLLTVPSQSTSADAIVCGTYDGEMIAVDPATLAIVHRGQPHEGSIKAMARLDGDAFVSCATDRVVAAGNLTQRAPLWEHGNLVNSVATLDGTVVASASRDHTVKVGWVSKDRRGRWRVDASSTLLGPDESVKCVGVLGTADAPVVLAGSYDFGVYAWPTSPRSSASSITSGTVVAEFGQGVSCIRRLDAVTAAVASWDGRIAIVRLRGDTVRVIAELSVADATSDAGLQR